jgi:hypothetical protein
MQPSYGLADLPMVSLSIEDPGCAGAARLSAPTEDDSCTRKQQNRRTS